MESSEPARALTLRILEALAGGAWPERVGVRLWDGSLWPEKGRSPAATLVLKHPGALRAMLLEGSEAALGEAYLRDDFDIAGDIEAAFDLNDAICRHARGYLRRWQLAGLLRRLPRRPAPGDDPGRIANLRDGQHTPGRDRAAVQFHYDVSNDFYALWLDQAKVYSCAYFHDAAEDLESAQRHKLNTICRKLALRPGQRLLDIGCGWGGLVLHAASHYGVHATGITLSERQAEYARARVCALGLQDRVDVRLLDYREMEGLECFDALVSVGMVEHVGRKNLPLYFRNAHRLLKPGGLFLNHGIGTGVAPTPGHGASFIDKYVFPDGDLYPIATMNAPAESAGFEIRDVENLREHYMLTLRRWVGRLEARHAEALAFVTEPVYRTWRVYMAGSAHRFENGQLAVYQTLLAKPGPGGKANVPLCRSAWYRSKRPGA